MLVLISNTVLSVSFHFLQQSLIQSQDINVGWILRYWVIYLRCFINRTMEVLEMRWTAQNRMQYKGRSVNISCFVFWTNGLSDRSKPVHETLRDLGYWTHTSQSTRGILSMTFDLVPSTPSFLSVSSCIHIPTHLVTSMCWMSSKDMVLPELFRIQS